MQRRATSTALTWAFLPFVVASILHVVLLAAGAPLAGPTKLLLMPMLAVPVLVSARRLKPRATLFLLLAALAFSWLGDGAGAFFPWAPELPLMLLFFGIAHVAYIVLFARHLTIRRMPWWALIYAAWWIAMIAFLGPHTGGLLIGSPSTGSCWVGQPPSPPGANPSSRSAARSSSPATRSSRSACSCPIRYRLGAVRQ